MSPGSKGGVGAAVALPAILVAARAVAIREIDESFITFVWDSETSFKCDQSKL